MNDVHDRLDRLRRAGRLRRPGSAPPPVLPSPPPPASPDLTDLRQLPGMEEVQGPEGAFLLRTTRFPLSHCQGATPLAALLDLPADAAAIAARDPALAPFDFRRVLFIDTETSGLAGGAGVIVFLTGVGAYEGDAYVVRQYFARHPGEERAYLPHLAAHLAGWQGIVSFNGRAFDLPLLRTRFLLAGLAPPTPTLPHFDLLHPARRLWRPRLGACHFGHLEQCILAHQRRGEDVPSWMIPEMWFAYARGQGSAAAMARVLYHNLEDIVSMAPLAYLLAGVFAGHLPPHPGDVLALAHSHEQQGQLAAAEALYRQALAQAEAQEDALLAPALAGLAAALKRQDRRGQALPFWQALAGLALPDQVEAEIELAKYYEWEQEDLAAALTWTEQALARVERWRGPQRGPMLADLRHRQARLLRKLAPAAAV